MFKVRCTPIAVAILLATSPFSVQAESGLYGSVRIGIEYIDARGNTDADLSLRSYASRLGFAGETDLDNGLTAFGKLEFGVDTRSGDNDDGALGTRHAYIGLKGDFGKITVGQTYHTWYNTVIAPVDQPWWGACNGCISYTERSSDGLSYAADFGTLSVGATAYLIPTDGANNTDKLDGFEVGVSFDAGITNVGIAIQDIEGSEAVLGVAVNGNYGDIGYAANVTMQDAANVGDEDGTGIDVYLSYGDYYLDVGQIDRGDTSTGLTLGYTRSIGRATTSWFELGSFDSGAAGADTVMGLRAALKYDWN